MNALGRFTLAFLLVAIGLALHQSFIFLNYFPASHLFPKPSPWFSSDRITTVPDENDLLWFVGPSDPWEEKWTDKQFQRSTSTFPDDLVLNARIASEASSSRAFLQRASSLDPENGFYDILMAARHAEKISLRSLEKKPLLTGLRKFNNKQDDLPKGRKKLEEHQADNRDALDLTLAALDRAAEEPFITAYGQESMERWAATVEPAYDVATGYQNFYLWLRSEAGHPLVGTSETIRKLADQLSNEGRSEELTQLIRNMEKNSWRLYESAKTPFHLFMARYSLRDAAQLVVKNSAQVKDKALLERAQKRVARFESYKQARDNPVDNDHWDNEKIPQRLYNTVLISLRTNLAQQLNDQDFRSAILAEQAHLSWRFYLWGLLIFVVLIFISLGLTRFFRKRQLILSKRLTIFNIAIPITLFLIYRYLTPWGGFDKGPG
jgi:hypothetical protein